MIIQRLVSIQLVIFSLFFAINTLAAPEGPDAKLCVETLNTPQNYIQPKPSLLSGHFEFKRIATKIYVQGTRSASRVLVLTTDEYRQAIKNNKISPDTILIVDSIPLDIDLPVVAGVIARAQLPMLGSHIEVLARVMKIPLIYQNDLNNTEPLNQFLKDFQTSNTRIQLSCTKESCTLQYGKELLSEEKIHSVLPYEADRSQLKIYNLDGSVSTAREFVGDKFFDLARLGRKVPSLIPDIHAISPGYFEKFLDLATVGEISLRLYISSQIKNIKIARSLGDEESVIDLLKSIEDAFLTAANKSNEINILFQNLSKELKATYQDPDIQYSVRSNNDVEDLIGAGLYESSIAKSLKPEDLKTSFLKVWKSLYNYRAFNIRNAMGQREGNLSMPILIHPYIGQQVFHGVGQFSILDSSLIFESDAVKGSGKATNPGPDDKIVKYRYATDLKHSFLKYLKKKFSLNSNGKLSNDIYSQPPKQMDEAMTLFMKKLRKTVTEEFRNRFYPINAVSIEYVIYLSPSGSYEVKVLQYKPNLNQESTLAIIRGDLTREQADQELPEVTDSLATEHLFKQLNAFTLDTLPSKVPNVETLRYALVKIAGQFEILVWKGEFHKSFKEKFNFYFEKGRWLKSGYLQYTTDKQMKFSRTTISSLDMRMSTKNARTALLSALNRAAQRSTKGSWFHQVLDEKEISLIAFNIHAIVHIELLKTIDGTNAPDITISPDEINVN